MNTTTANWQVEPAVARDAEGNYVVTWTSFGQDGDQGGIYLQRFSASGVPRSGEVRVNSATAATQTDSAVAMSADGAFVVVWSTEQQDSDGLAVHGQRYTAAGTPQGVEFRVNQTTTGHQYRPAVAMDADGDFVVAWTSISPVGPNADVYARRFDADGTPAGGEVLANTLSIPDDQDNAVVAMDADGDYVVAWESLGHDGDGLGVYAQFYAADGTEDGSEFRVNSTTASNQQDPSVAMDAAGGTVISWTSFGQDGSGEGVYLQRYSSTGQLDGAETRVNSTIQFGQSSPWVAMDADGDHVVAWTSSGQDGDGLGVYLQRFAAGGTPQGPERRVNVSTDSDQFQPMVAADVDGDLVVVWTSLVDDGAYDVYARRFRGPGEVDLSVVQAASADPVAVSSRLVYRIRVANRTEESEDLGVAVLDAAVGAATGVRVVVAPPDRAILQEVDGPWICGSPAATLVCRYDDVVRAGDLAPDLRLTYTAPDWAGPALHSVRVAQTHADPVADNNGGTDSVRVLCVVEFEAPAYSTLEAGNLAARVWRRGEYCGAASVDYETVGGSATPGQDFGTASDRIVLDDVAPEQSLEVPIVPDSLDETTERFSLRLSQPAGALLGHRSRVTVAISDNDPPPRINFTATTGTAAEPGAIVEVTLRLSEISGQPVTVTLGRTGTATDGADYFAPAKVTIPAGQKTVEFSVEVADDHLAEGNETAVLTLTTPVAVTIGTLRTFRLTITSNE